MMKTRGVVLLLASACKKEEEPPFKPNPRPRLPKPGGR